MKLSPLVKTPLKYGLIGGMLSALLITMLFYIDRHPFLIPIFLDFRLLLLPLFIFFATKEFRDYRNNKELHFWQGMSAGFVTYTSLGLFAGIYVLIFAGMIESDFVAQFVEISKSQLEANRESVVEAVGVDAYEKAVSSLPQTSAGDLAFDYFLKTLIIGMFVTIIISVILRRHKTI